MKVSALIITYNQENFIAAAIESALMQETDFDFESSNSTREMYGAKKNC